MKPELLSPAGDWPGLQTAVDSGADAVYFGVKGINMRQCADNFEPLEIKKVMSLLHNNNKKGYLALNTIIYNTETEKIKKLLEQAKDAEVDGIILWDMAVLNLAKEIGLDIHLSTQASVANFEAVKYYASLGVKRIVLARECSLSDIRDIIKQINKEKLDVQIETFIHGALCVVSPAAVSCPIIHLPSQPIEANVFSPAAVNIRSPMLMMTSINIFWVRIIFLVLRIYVL